jgi:hypothetical protein
MSARHLFPKTSDEILFPKVTGRLSTEAILSRCHALPDQDRALIRAVYLGQQSATEVARVRGQRPRTVRRHVHAILERLHSPEFLFVLRHRARWSKLRCRVATALYIDGHPLAKVAADLNLSYFEVRRQRDAILGMIEAAQAAPQPAAPDDARAFLKEVKS